VLFGPDGQTAIVANALDDSLTLIDVAGLEAVARIDLGGPTEITQVGTASAFSIAPTSAGDGSSRATRAIPTAT